MPNAPSTLVRPAPSSPKDFALVTGGSSGIGFALARELARHGYPLILVAERLDALDRAADLFRTDHGVEVITLAKDLTEEQAPQEIYDELQARQLTVEILVNNAGVGQRGTFAAIPLEKEIRIIRLNVEALTRLTKLFLNAMLPRGRGRILNLGSVAGFQPGPTLAVYHATKAFVVSLSEALAEELKDSGITVTCLCPGPTATHFFERADMEDVKILKMGTVMNAEDVAKGAYEALMDGERVYIPGASNKILTFTRRLIPQSLQAKIHRKLYEEAEEPVATPSA